MIRRDKEMGIKLPTAKRRACARNGLRSWTVPQSWTVCWWHSCGTYPAGETRGSNDDPRAILFTTMINLDELDMRVGIGQFSKIAHANRLRVVV